MRLVVRNRSRNGTEVTYSDKGGGNRGGGFQWIVGGDEQIVNERIVLRPSRDMAFRIFVNISLFKNIQSFAALIDKFRHGSKSVKCRLSKLDLASSCTSVAASGTQTPSITPIHLQEEQGKGTFGTVELCWNVSTGEKLAAKTPCDRSMIKGSDEWIKWENEICAMNSLKHVSGNPHILQSHL